MTEWSRVISYAKRFQHTLIHSKGLMAQIARLRVIICSALRLSSIKKSFPWVLCWLLLLENPLVIVTFVIQVFVNLGLIEYFFDLIKLFVGLTNLFIASILMFFGRGNLLSLLVMQEGWMQHVHFQTRFLLNGCCIDSQGSIYCQSCPICEIVLALELDSSLFNFLLHLKSCELSGILYILGIL